MQKDKPSLIVVSHNLPNTPESGGTLRVFYLIKDLQNFFNITYFAPYFCETEKKTFLKNYKEIFNKVKFELVKFENKKYLNLINNLFTLNPSFIKKYTNPIKYFRLKLSIGQLLSEEEIKIIHIDTIKARQYVKTKYYKKYASVFLLPDSMYLYYTRLTKLLPNSLRKVWMKYQTFCVKNYEKNSLRLTSKSIVNSDVDQMFIQKSFNTIPFFIPNGVDLNFYKNIKNSDVSNNILFTGVMSYDFNHDAMMWFINNIWSDLKIQKPDLKLFIVGKDPKPELQKFHNNSDIIVTGYVKTINPYLEKASIFISPLQTGTGFKNKILVAMAAKLPVLATKISCDGMKFEDDKHVLLAENKEDFIEKTIALTEDIELKNRLVNNAYSFVNENYTWKNYCNSINDIYKSLLKNED